MDDEIAAVPRRVPLSTVFNFRDLGGYRSSSGAVVRDGLVFRADGLNRVVEDDHETLRSIGLRTIVDLRTQAELDDWGVAPAAALGARLVHLPMIPELWSRASVEGVRDHGDTVEYLAARYQEMTDVGVDTLTAVLGMIAEDRADHLPLVFHCSAGKDRTGVTASILLGLLGVPDEIVATDYALTSGAMEELVAWVRVTHPDAVDSMADQPPSFLACPPEAMLGFLEGLRARHGSVEGYVRDIGVDAATVDAVRRRMLLPAAA